MREAGHATAGGVAGGFRGEPAAIGHGAPQGGSKEISLDCLAHGVDNPVAKARAGTWPYTRDATAAQELSAGRRGDDQTAS